MSLSLTDGIPTVAELMDSPLAKYITLAANDCGYGGTTEELIVSYVHPLFLKAHSAASKEDNQTGSRLLEASLPTSIGRLWSWRLQPWKELMHGRLRNTILRLCQTSFDRHGLSNASDILMV